MCYLTAKCSVVSRAWQDMTMESGTGLLFSEYLPVYEVKSETIFNMP